MRYRDTPNPNMNNNGYGGGNIYGGANGRVAETNRNIYEDENNRRLNDLGDQVSLLKELTIDIGDTVRDHNRYLDGIVSINNIYILMYTV